MGLISDAQTAFGEIYDKDLWGLASGEWSAAREGEEPEADRVARLVALIQSLIRLNGVKSVVEFGCGHWSYARQIDWTGVDYDGFDVVEDVVSKNDDNHRCANIRFHRVADGVVLPPADLLISKDVLQHLPTSHVQYYLGLFRKNFKLMLIGNDVVPDGNLNGDISPGGYRALRLELPPFNEPNVVLQSWTSGDFGIHTVKNFCLLFGQPGHAPDGLSFSDLALTAQSGTPARGLRTAMRDAVAEVPPLDRLARSLLKRPRRS